MQYKLSGDFYEVCDCEVICSCWAGVDPDMGSCTGMFVWTLDAGATINDSIQVGGCTVMLVSEGSDCSTAKHALVLIDAPDDATRAVLAQAALNLPGPWSAVVDTAGAAPEVRAARIVINQVASASLAGTVVISIAATAPSVAAEAHCQFYPDGVYALQSSDAGTLLGRSNGGVPATAQAGKVVTDATSGSGLNLLASIDPAKDDYTFDLDITRVSAVRGKFNYVAP
jgi:hypothetical protein